MKPIWGILFLFAVFQVGASTLAQQPGPAAVESTTVPVSRDPAWMQRHELIKSRVAKGNVNLLFAGDSITARWENVGQAVWEEYYANRGAANLGIGGDGTQHLLWRLEHGEIDGIAPKLAIVLIGTNNSRDHTPVEIADGVQAVLNELRKRLPQTRILLMAIFPRGPDDHNPYHRVVAKTNELIAKFADGDKIQFLDLTQKLNHPDGSRDPAILPDFLHPSEAGYRIWAEAIEPMVTASVGPR